MIGEAVPVRLYGMALKDPSSDKPDIRVVMVAGEGEKCNVFMFPQNLRRHGLEPVGGRDRMDMLIAAGEIKPEPAGGGGDDDGQL